MSGVNKFIGIGNVGADPETHTFDSGDMVAKISLGISETYKNKEGEKVTKTEWVKFIFRRKLAEIVSEYVKKGASLYIEGKLRNRNYTNKEGNKVYYTEVEADTMQMLGGKPKQTESQNQEPEQETQTDDLPF